MKKILVVSWFFPPINSSEGLVTYKLLNNSELSYDVYTQKNNNNWSYGKEDYLPLNKNINCIFSPANNLEEFKKEAILYYEKNKDKYDLIMTRAMPEESHMIGLEIKQISPNIKWIASFGDPIGNNPFTMKALKSVNPYSLKMRYERKMGIKEILSPKRMLKSSIYNSRHKKNYKSFIGTKNVLESEILNNCDYVICNSEEQKNYIINNNKGTKEEKFIILPHSYEESLYPKKSNKDNTKKVFTYIGHLDDIRTPKLFLEVINRLKEENENLSDIVSFEFYGNMSDTDKLYIINNDLFDVVKIKKPVGYQKSLEIMKNSDWLIHIDANLFDIIDKNIFFAAKLADYIGSEQKIIGLTMLDGASANILRENDALVLTYSKEEIYNYLYLILYKDFNINMNSKARKNYSAKNVAKNFDKFVKEIYK